MGALVVLRGLQAKPELNGCTGQVCGAAGSAGGAAGTGRYPVELDAGQVGSSCGRGGKMTQRHNSEIKSYIPPYCFVLIPILFLTLWCKS